MNRRFSKRVLIGTVLTVILILSGLLYFKFNKEASPFTLNIYSGNKESNYVLEKDSGEKIMWTDNSVGKEYKVSYKKFNGTQIKYLKVTNGQELLFNFESKVNEGNLEVQIEDEKGNILASPSMNQKCEKEIKVDYDGKLMINVIGKNTNGYFDISYQ